MQPGRWLVEDVHRVLCALELAQLRRDLDALRFAAGERRRRLAEREVAESEVAQHFDLFADGRLRLEELDALFDRHVEDLSLIHISEPTRLLSISYAVFCLKK